MIALERHEQIRRAYYVDEKSMRQIEQEMGHSYWTIRKALTQSVPEPYRLKEEKPAPVLGPYKGRIDGLLAENAILPRKQRYTGNKIYQIIRAEGYLGAPSTVRRYVGRQRRELKRPPIYIPLEFDPGQDAQIDWGEAWVEMEGVRCQVELFVMRLCYSRKTFVMAFPTQRQECFLRGSCRRLSRTGRCAPSAQLRQPDHSSQAGAARAQPGRASGFHRSAQSLPV